VSDGVLSGLEKDETQLEYFSFKNHKNKKKLKRQLAVFIYDYSFLLGLFKNPFSLVEPWRSYFADSLLTRMQWAISPTTAWQIVIFQFPPFPSLHDWERKRNGELKRDKKINRQYPRERGTKETKKKVVFFFLFFHHLEMDPPQS
jgi:hypothetical protein